MDFKKITLNCLQKQYGYTNISALMIEKASVYNKYIGNLSQTFGKEILDYNTCVPEALDYFWGRMFKISRVFSDQDGTPFSLNDEQFREIIKICAFGTTWDGSLESINLFLSNLFKDRGRVYLIDPQDMSFELFVFDFELEPWERYLFSKKDILPRPAGVGANILEVTEQFFGFEKYSQIYESPVTKGFTTYETDENGRFATYLDTNI